MEKKSAAGGLAIIQSALWSEDAWNDIKRIFRFDAHAFAIIFLVFTTLSGKLSLLRLLPFLGEATSHIEVRFLFLALAFISLLVGLAGGAKHALRKPLVIVCTFLGFLALCIAHVLMFRGGAGSNGYLVDFSTLFVLCLALGLIVHDERDRRLCAWVITVAALALSLHGALGIGSGDNSPLGWNPIGTNVSFVRITFFGIAAASYLVFSYRTGRAWLLLALLFLGYASVSSLLKVSLLLAACWVAASCAITVIARRKGTNIYVTLAVFAGFGLSLLANNDVMLKRISASLLTSSPTPVATTGGPAATPPETPTTTDQPGSASGGPILTNDLFVNEELRLLGYPDPNAMAKDIWPNRIRPYACIAVPDTESMTVQQFLTQEIPTQQWKCIFTDKTDRFRFIIEALRLFFSDPILGAGFGSYHIETYEYGLYSYEYPHNVPLEILLSGGMIIFFCFFIVTTLFFIVSVMKAYSDFSLAPIAVFLPVIFTAGIFGGDFYDIRYYYIAVIMFLGSRTTTSQV